LHGLHTEADYASRKYVSIDGLIDRAVICNTDKMGYSRAIIVLIMLLLLIGSLCSDRLLDVALSIHW